MPLTRPLTAAEAAEILRVGPWQVMTLCRSGKLPASKPGKTWLIEEDDLRDYIAAASNQKAAS